LRILLASDLHYRLPQYDWLLGVAAEFDVMALPGDHLELVGAVPLAAQIVVIDRYLARLGERTTVVTCSGNHDLDGAGSHGEKMARWIRRVAHPAVHVDDATADVEGMRFTACPWWDGPRTREALDQLLEAEAARRRGPWTWLYHSPPADTGLCWNGRRRFPDADLVGWIQRFAPSFVLCGHIHEAPFAEDGAWSARIGETWVFNAGSQPGPIPPHVVIDTEAGTARWSCARAEAEIQLRS
jgi:Icc-related predicted phosphoesterase